MYVHVLEPESVGPVIAISMIERDEDVLVDWKQIINPYLLQNKKITKLVIIHNVF